MSTTAPLPPPMDVSRAAPPATAPRTLQVTSAQLFAGASELQIAHRGALYRLKQTSSGKLILTK